MSALTLAEMDPSALTLVLVAIGVGGSITLISMFINLAQNMHRTRQVEQSRREIAAYIAEGSITAQEGERLLRAEPGKRDGVAGMWNWGGWGGCGKR